MQHLKSRRGDTLVEVLFSITVFALIAVITVSLMNSGIYTAQKSLEVTMARNEIDAQAEALRFIHNSYLAEKELATGSKQFMALWQTLTSDRNALDLTSPGLAERFSESFNSWDNCEEAYDPTRDFSVHNPSTNTFVLNTRLIQPENVNTHITYDEDSTINYTALLDKMVVNSKNSLGDYKLKEATVYPRILYSKWGGNSIFDPNNDAANLKEEAMYREISSAEGIWIVAVKGGTRDPNTRQPEYFDFHIRTCWHSVGRYVPSTIGTIVRLYNPDIIE
ncbi:type II secretion system GspH family protein [Candidatus Saccharibacteria bacterium]|nr:type II secretion system GspH family protein [Candidatus Saccharibacteria bacterium]